MVAFGTCSRIGRGIIPIAAAQGVRVGLIRPITLWPFPSDVIARAAAQPSVKAVLTIELSCGQMVEDVRLAVDGMKPIAFLGRSGGNLPTQKEILQKIMKMVGR